MTAIAETPAPETVEADWWQLITDADREHLLGPPKVEFPRPHPEPDSPAFAEWDRQAYVEQAEACIKYLEWNERRHPAPCVFCGGRTVHNPQCFAVTAAGDVKMPFGRHKGKKVKDVPADYCRWLVAEGVRPNEAEVVAAVEDRAGKRYQEV